MRAKFVPRYRFYLRYPKNSNHYSESGDVASDVYAFAVTVALIDKNVDNGKSHLVILASFPLADISSDHRLALNNACLNFLEAQYQ